MEPININTRRFGWFCDLIWGVAVLKIQGYVLDEASSKQKTKNQICCTGIEKVFSLVVIWMDITFLAANIRFEAFQQDNIEID